MSSEGFEDSFRRHLIPEQRRALLETIARELSPDTTLGEVVDAVESLGWGEHMGELCLAELAGVLVHGEDADTPEPDVPPEASIAADADAEGEDEAEDEAEDEDEDEDVDVDEDAVQLLLSPSRSSRSRAKSSSRAKRSAKTKAKKAAKKTSSRAKKSTKKTASKSAKKKATKKKAAKKKAAKKKTAKATKKKTTKKKAAKKKAAKKKSSSGRKAKLVAPIDDEAMSIEQAARKLVPLVRKYKQATMQDLEEATGLGRRKLRFHVGQLVKHGKLKRHGMGRGTHYTVK